MLARVWGLEMGRFEVGPKSCYFVLENMYFTRPLQTIFLQFVGARQLCVRSIENEIECSR